jgi:hypothetical protein
MSNTIENRTVFMDFQNKEFEKGVSNSMKSIDSLKKGLDFTGAGKGLNEINSSASKMNFGNISDGVDALKNRFSLMGIVGMTVIQNLTNAAIDLTKKLVETVLGVDAIKTGFGGYETKINAVKTVMSGTGETIEEVTKSLE